MDNETRQRIEVLEKENVKLRDRQMETAQWEAASRQMLLSLENQLTAVQTSFSNEMSAVRKSVENLEKLLQKIASRPSWGVMWAMGAMLTTIGFLVKAVIE